MFKRLGRLAASHPWLICLAWLVIALTMFLVAPSGDKRVLDDDVRFLPERCASVRGYHLLEEAFPGDVFASRAIFAVERKDAPLTENDFAVVDRIVADINKLKVAEPELRINGVGSHRDPLVGRRLVSRDGRCTLVQLALGTPYLALQTKATVDRVERVVQQRLAEAGANAPQAYTTGAAGIGRDLATSGGNSLEATTLATVLLVIVILLFVYRSPLLALVPLVTIALSVWVALKLLALCTLIPGFYLVNISQIFAVVMLYGAGTDYCLFLISRYREELMKGAEPGLALSRAVGKVGWALTASAGTVVCGLGMMGFAEFAKVRSGGPAIAVSLVVALLASLTLTPALLRLCGRFAFWPVGLPQKTAQTRPGVWDWLAGRVVARPLLIWGVAVVALLPLAFLGLGVRANYRATGELSPRCGSVQGLAAIQRHFTAGEVGPVTVLLESDTDWDSPRGRAAIDYLSKGFGRLDNVAEVRSLTQPLGATVSTPTASVPAPPSASGRGKRWLGDLLQSKGVQDVITGVNVRVQQGANDFYLKKKLAAANGAAPRYVTRLDVVLKSDPFDPRSIETLETLQLWLRSRLPGAAEGVGTVRAECYGVTVSARDLAQVTERDRLRINALVLAGIFVILLALVRRTWLAGYLLVTVLFSYYVTLGATTLFAQWVSGRPPGEVDWRVPFFLFIILVAVGEDYNILLITRTLQERQRRGARAGIRRALARTGGTITSCGLIMAGTFATLMLSGLNTLVQIGFALAFGVLLDTFVVRPFLVPALTWWVWRWQEQQGEQGRSERPEAQKPLLEARIRRAG